MEFLFLNAIAEARFAFNYPTTKTAVLHNVQHSVLPWTA